LRASRDRHRDPGADERIATPAQMSAALRRVAPPRSVRWIIRPGAMPKGSVLVVDDIQGSSVPGGQLVSIWLLTSGHALVCAPPAAVSGTMIHSGG
jgi:hypothetical protein